MFLGQASNKMTVHHVKSVEEYEKFLNRGKNIVIDFSASWCGPCRTIAPLYDTLSKEFPDLIFLKVDVDEVPAMAQRFEVRSMPSFIFQDPFGNSVFQKLVGADSGSLKQQIQLLHQHQQRK